MDELDIEIMTRQLELYKLTRTDYSQQKANLDEINKLIDAMWSYVKTKHIVSFNAYGDIEWPEGHELEGQGNVLIRALYGIDAGYISWEQESWNINNWAMSLRLR
jgi:hypothetical protein